MRPLAPACVLLLVVCGVAVAAPFDFAKERSRVVSYLAAEHCDLGKEYARLGFNQDARFHFERARLLVPEHSEAMKGLGYKRTKDGWVMDKPLPQADAELPPAKRAELRKGPDKEREKFWGKARERLRELAKNAASAGQGDNSSLAWSELLYYAPTDAEANEKLNRARGDDGTFLGAKLKQARDAGTKIVEASSEGESAGKDGQGKELEFELHLRKGGAIVARSTESDKRAARLHRVCEGAFKLANELVGATNPGINEKKPYTVTSVRSREQYEKLVKLFSGKSGEQLEHALKLKGTGTRKPWGYVSYETSNEGTDDMLANQTAGAALQNHRGDASDPWITTGFCYLVTGRLLGTTRCVRFAVDVEETTTARPDDPLDRMAADSRSPQGLRRHVLRAVRENRELSLNMLAATPLNRLSVGHAATAFSVFEFFFDKYPETTRKWLAERPAREQAELLTLEKVFMKSPKLLQEEWRLWVLCNY